MAQQTGRSVWITTRDERKCKCIQDRGIYGGVAGRSDLIFWRTRKPLVETALSLLRPRRFR